MYLASHHHLACNAGILLGDESLHYKLVMVCRTTMSDFGKSEQVGGG